VNYLEPKRAPLRLNSELYDQLRNQVLRRDGWRCQSCGTMFNLEVHHKQFRGQSGHDSEENLITLCAGCHARSHNC
jgi:ATP-dependent DNA helicase RecQ